MQAIAAFKLDLKLTQVPDESMGRHANMVVLNCLRMLYDMASGETGADLRKVVESDSPTELPNFDRAQKAAIENLAELRAFVAFVTGENDDEELGIEVLPPADWSNCRSNSKSVSLPL